MTPPNRLLIVDDEPYLRSFLKDLLEPRFEVRTAENGHAALAVDEDELEVILIDVTMPGMSGEDACRRLRARHPRAAIIMVTARDEDSVRDGCLRAGADGFVAKPFRPDDLLSCIDRCRRD